MQKKILSFFFVLSVFLFLQKSFVYAQRGCCSWHGGVSGCDGSVGRIVCNDGTYSPSCGCARDIQILPTNTPLPTLVALSINAITQYTYNASSKSYDVMFNWDDVTDSEGYSVNVSSIARNDPGPLVDTISSYFKFTKLTPGSKYINLKSKQDGRWSNIAYWDITVPPYPTANITKKTVNTIYPTKKPTKYISKEVTPTIRRVWIEPTKIEKKYTCNCGKTCTAISSCEEAYFQLDECGCSIRDGDGDGIPCENICR